MKERIKVTIEDIKWIPSVGRGPIRNPISITLDHYNLLKLLGFNVIPFVEDIKAEPIELPKKKIEKAKEVKVVKEEVLVNEITEEVKEVETLIDEVKEETIVNEIKEENVVEETIIEETEKEELNIDSMTKKQLKAELDKRNISYLQNATVDQLKKLLSENI